MVTVDRDAMTPAQRRAWDELLDAGGSRPPVDEAVATRWQAWLTDELLEAAAAVPHGDRGLYVNKSALDALDCDGRFLDREDEPFAWTVVMVVGQLAHKAIELNLAGHRKGAVGDVLDRAWADFAGSGATAGEFLATLGGVDADDPRARALRRILEFRETFPLMPADVVRRRWTAPFGAAGGASSSRDGKTWWLGARTPSSGRSSSST